LIKVLWKLYLYASKRRRPKTTLQGYVSKPSPPEDTTSFRWSHLHINLRIKPNEANLLPIEYGVYTSSHRRVVIRSTRWILHSSRPRFSEAIMEGLRKDNLTGEQRYSSTRDSANDLTRPCKTFIYLRQEKLFTGF